MNKLFCKPCLAFEALAALVFCNFCRDDVPEIKGWVDKTFEGINIGTSNQFFNPLITHHTFEEIESFSIEKLVEIYPLYAIKTNTSIKLIGFSMNFAPIRETKKSLSKQ